VLPARTHFSQIEVPKLYSKVREQVEKEIRSIEHYATTTDLWSSRTMEPYLEQYISFGVYSEQHVKDFNRTSYYAEGSMRMERAIKDDFSAIGQYTFQTTFETTFSEFVCFSKPLSGK
jgi:hypothetical protein